MGKTTGSGSLVETYIPRCADFIKLDITIGAEGREQKGYRFALVVSRNSFNSHGSLIVICPITNTDRGDPFQLEILDSAVITGFILVDQVRSLDYAGRGVSYLDRCPQPLYREALRCLRVILFPKDVGLFK